MSPGETTYYRERAVTQRAMAQLSERQDVREIHEQHARLFDALGEQECLRDEPVRLFG
jgi:hypothetical protein